MGIRGQKLQLKRTDKMGKKWLGLFIALCVFMSQAQPLLAEEYDSTTTGTTADTATYDSSTSSEGFFGSIWSGIESAASGVYTGVDFVAGGVLPGGTGVEGSAIGWSAAQVGAGATEVYDHVLEPAAGTVADGAVWTGNQIGAGATEVYDHVLAPAYEGGIEPAVSGLYTGTDFITGGILPGGTSFEGSAVGWSGSQVGAGASEVYERVLEPAYEKVLAPVGGAIYKGIDAVAAAGTLPAGSSFEGSAVGQVYKHAAQPAYEKVLAPVGGALYKGIDAVAAAGTLPGGSSFEGSAVGQAYKHAAQPAYEKAIKPIYESGIKPAAEAVYGSGIKPVAGFFDDLSRIIPGGKKFADTGTGKWIDDKTALPYGGKAFVKTPVGKAVDFLTGLPLGGISPARSAMNYLPPFSLQSDVIKTVVDLPKFFKFVPYGALDFASLYPKTSKEMGTKGATNIGYYIWAPLGHAIDYFKSEPKEIAAATPKVAPQPELVSVEPRVDKLPAFESPKAQPAEAQPTPLTPPQPRPSVPAAAEPGAKPPAPISKVESKPAGAPSTIPTVAPRTREEKLAATEKSISSLEQQRNQAQAELRALQNIRVPQKELQKEFTSLQKELSTLDKVKDKAAYDVKLQRLRELMDNYSYDSKSDYALEKSIREKKDLLGTYNRLIEYTKADREVLGGISAEAQKIAPTSGEAGALIMLPAKPVEVPKTAEERIKLQQKASQLEQDLLSHPVIPGLGSAQRVERAEKLATLQGMKGALSVSEPISAKQARLDGLNQDLKQLEGFRSELADKVTKINQAEKVLFEAMPGQRPLGQNLTSEQRKETLDNITILFHQTRAPDSAANQYRDVLKMYEQQIAEVKGMRDELAKQIPQLELVEIPSIPSDTGQASISYPRPSLGEAEVGRYPQPEISAPTTADVQTPTPALSATFLTIPTRGAEGLEGAGGATISFLYKEPTGQQRLMAQRAAEVVAQSEYAKTHSSRVPGVLGGFNVTYSDPRWNAQKGHYEIDMTVQNLNTNQIETVTGFGRVGGYDYTPLDTQGK